MKDYTQRFGELICWFVARFVRVYGGAYGEAASAGMHFEKMSYLVLFRPSNTSPSRVFVWKVNCFMLDRSLLLTSCSSEPGRNFLWYSFRLREVFSFDVNQLCSQAEMATSKSANPLTDMKSGWLLR
jgi:hypothetical protein